MASQFKVTGYVRGHNDQAQSPQINLYKWTNFLVGGCFLLQNVFRFKWHWTWIRSKRQTNLIHTHTFTRQIYNSIEVGSSKCFWKYCNQRAPTAPSTVRWSQLRVTEMKSFCFQPCSEFLSGTMRCWVPPTANMHDCGGLMTAQKWVTPENGRNIVGVSRIFRGVIETRAKLSRCSSEHVVEILIGTWSQDNAYRTCPSWKRWWCRLGIRVVAIYRHGPWLPIP